MSPATPSRTRRVVLIARLVFLVVVAVAVVLAFRGHGDDVVAAVRAVPPVAVAAAGVLVLVGLVSTSAAWLAVLAAFGHPLPARRGRAVFFVGQLGKYVPGGVWSIGAHAHLAADLGVPVRVTAGTSLVFLGLNLATAAVVLGAVAVAGGGAVLLPGGPDGVLGALLVLLGAVALAPPVVRRLAGVVAGRAGTLRLGWRRTAGLALLLLLTWTCYAVALVLLLPDPRPGLVPLAAAAFTLSYAVGVLVVVAPAGVGAREVTLVALLAPAIGVGPAAVAAVLTRLVHTGADVLCALAAWAWSRVTARPPATGRSAVGHPPVGGRT